MRVGPAAPVQKDASTFYVKRVEAITEYDSTYIHGLAYMILPPDELRGPDDVGCLVSELKSSGMFQDVRVNLRPAEEGDSRVLEINTEYQPGLESFHISDIELGGFPQLDRAQFRAALSDKGVRVGMPLQEYPYSELRERVAGALRAMPLKHSTERAPRFWVAIKAAGVREVKLIITPDYSGRNVKDKL